MAAGTPLQQSAFLASFECLGAECPDTCCKGWNMQLDAPVRDRYAAEAPELLDAVSDDGCGGFIMRRDAGTDYCVRFDNGLCGIQRDYGTGFLGDACHFYPRVTRSLGSVTLMTATPSCPEVARLALYGEMPTRLEAGEAARLPVSLKNYLPAALSPEAALEVHAHFLNAAAPEDAPAERAFCRIAGVARSLERLPQESWPQAAAFYLQSADARLVPAEPKPEDPFNLLHALCGLSVAARRPPSERLLLTMAPMQEMLGVTLDWETAGMQLAPDSLQQSALLQRRWRAEWAETYRDVFKRWLQLQMSMALFPFAGLGDTPVERITLIGVRMATFKLALMCACGKAGGTAPPEEVARIAQSLARLLDHLASPQYSLKIYEETGWTREGRMRGLLGDSPPV